VTVGNELILKVKIDLVALCLIQMLSQNRNMEDNQDNLACTPLEILEIAKNTVKFFHLTLLVLDTFC
jgi:superfamily II DNA/RNA helicase